VDFMPYEGTPPEGGHDSRRLMIAVLTVAAMLGGAWVLTDAIPASRQSPVGQSIGPSPKMAAHSGNVGPVKSELPNRPAIER